MPLLRPVHALETSAGFVPWTMRPSSGSRSRKNTAGKRLRGRRRGRKRIRTRAPPKSDENQQPTSAHAAAHTQHREMVHDTKSRLGQETVCVFCSDELNFNGTAGVERAFVLFVERNEIATERLMIRAAVLKGTKNFDGK